MGGTGMLRDVCLHLAGAGRVVSAVARTHSRLSAVVRDAAGLSGSIHPLPADYTNGQELALAIRSAIAARGPIALAVCWIHSTAPDGPRMVAEMIASPVSVPVFLHVLGSEAADPTGPELGHAEVREVEGIRCRRVVLGFVVEGGRSRWLSNDEIAAGVIGAIQTGREETVVGQVVPWGSRPG